MIKINGPTVDNESRCIHYQTPLDIIAIKFKCCNKYYPCYKCHEANEDHDIKRWKHEEYDEKAVLCGVCQYEMTINEYMMVEACPKCNGHFNNRCKFHYHHYFSV
ncbi:MULTISPECIES: CHY zinc finger protein [Staphylococcus]|uniref:CHY zinc finger protein n=1 Tax=Staphylococcus hsinchuensis TaxID=3051183 RepID=A0ABZ3EGZ6_9STAP|nr:CHY zinc finger protein [Staphylococcus sp. Marseille-Q6910]